jgi:RNA methyltransferase, TrmH family
MKSNRKELKFYGIHACLELWKKRQNDIIRVYLSKNNLSIFSSLLKWCSKAKKAYHIVEDDELIKITDSTHHEGVCILALEKQSFPFKKIPLNENCCLLFLDGISNPHNLGSLIRTCVHFGLEYLIGEKNKLPFLSPSACRIAKGGAEHVSISYLDNINELKMLKEKGYTFVATDSNDKKAISLYQYSFPSKTLIILGSEEKGVSNYLLKESDAILKIPGTDKIESLNVSAATSIFLGEFWRQNNRIK